MRGRSFFHRNATISISAELAAAELPLPMPEPLAEPLVLAEPPLLLPLLSEATPDEPLPLVMSRSPHAADFSFG